MRIVDIRETAIPLKSNLRNSGFDFSEMTTSVVAVITAEVRTLMLMVMVMSVNVKSQTATIDGDTTVCLNASSPSVTFTGIGGTGSPYTFNYSNR